MLKSKIQKHLDLLVDRYPLLSVCKDDIEKVYLILEECYKNDHKLLIVGNGGLAVDLEHITGELMKRFRILRHVPKNLAEKLKYVDVVRGKIFLIILNVDLWLFLW